MTGLLKDWLVTPHDLVLSGEEIYISSNADKRIAVVNPDGQISRYYEVEKNEEFDNVCVGVTSQGQVLAVSSRGVWELRPDGETRELSKFRLSIDHMTVGPDDAIYVSHRSNGRFLISRLSLDGTITDLVTVDSKRISDLDFDSKGNLLMVDGEHGQILKYSQQQGIEIISRVFSDPGDPAYLTYDKAGRLYTASSRSGLALVSADGNVTPLGINVSGDLVFHGDLLYALDIYTSTLWRIGIDGKTIQSKRVLLNGSVPWYIDHQGDIVVGERNDFRGRQFYNYYIGDPMRIEPNQMLNELQPDQYTFDDAGNAYLLFGNVLKKVNPAGSEESSVMLPGKFQWNTRLHYNFADDRIYYFDEESNSVIRANMQGAEIYHKFSSKAIRVFLATTRQGRIYAAFVSLDGSKLIEISDPPQERVIWRPPYRELFWFQIASDADGNLYAALGPVFQQVLSIDPLKSEALSIVQESPSRYDMGFVDPQGFTVTKSGTVVLSAPGVLIGFSRR